MSNSTNDASHAPQAPKPIKHAVIAAHPDPDSFTAAMAREYVDTVKVRGQVAILRDLYSLNFDPVLKMNERLPSAPFTPAPDVAAELAKIADADVFVLVYPMWFGTPPAILKGYVERVFAAGFSGPGQYRWGPSHPWLGGKQLLSLSCSGSSALWSGQKGAESAHQSAFDGYVARAFWMDSPQHVHFEPIFAGLDEATASSHLATVRRQAETMCDWMRRPTERPE